MSHESVTVNTIESEEQRWIRVGGISSLAIGIAYLVIILLYALAGVPPSGSEAWLEYLSGKTTVWWAIIGLSVLTNFLYVPTALGLHLALKRVNTYAMFIAVAFVGLFVVLESAVNWPSYAALVGLSSEYAAATTDTQRAAYIAAASYPSAILTSRLAVVYAVGTLSFAFLITGFVMLKGVFNRFTAYLGMITGILGIVAVAGLSVAVILNAVCATIWLFFVGYRLYQLAQR